MDTVCLCAIQDLFYFQLIRLSRLLADRRALFLSRVQPPPSPTAPETQPDSPGLFHHSLPSPGLESSLTLFESWSGNHTDDVLDAWVERVDLHLVDDVPKPSLNRSSTKPVCGLPSLDQISARFPRSAKLDDIKMTSGALTNEESPRPSVGIGRLRMPLRTRSILQSDNQQTKTLFKSPPPPLSLEPCAKTHVVPRSPSSTPAHLTESNLNSLNSRDQKTYKMLFTLRKRRLSSELDLNVQETNIIESEEEAKLRWRRSAPADITPLRARFGFEHPVLASPGGF